MYMKENFNISEESKAEKQLKILEEEINKLPESSPGRKSLEILVIPLKIRARRWLKRSKLKDIKINHIHRNEQINIVALCAGHQILMCDYEMNKPNEYYLLDPMKGTETWYGEYTRNKLGKLFEVIIHNEWGKELEEFPRKFVAQVDCRLLVETKIQKFWEELVREELFEFWDPEGGPGKWCEDHPHPRIPILRVFEIDGDLHRSIHYHPTKPPDLSQKGIQAKATPVLTNGEFALQLQRLWNICKKPEYKIQVEHHPLNAQLGDECQ